MSHSVWHRVLDSSDYEYNCSIYDDWLPESRQGIGSIWIPPQLATPFIDPASYIVWSPESIIPSKHYTLCCTKPRNEPTAHSTMDILVLLPTVSVRRSLPQGWFHVPPRIFQALWSFTGWLHNTGWGAEDRAWWSVAGWANVTIYVIILNLQHGAGSNCVENGHCPLIIHRAPTPFRFYARACSYHE